MRLHVLAFAVVVVLRTDALANDELIVAGAHASDLAGVVITDDGTTAVSISEDHTVRAWDVATGTALRVRDYEPWLRQIAVDPEGVIVGTSDGAVELLTLPGLELVERWQGTADIGALATSPSGTWRAIGDADGDLHVWNRDAGTTTTCQVPEVDGWTGRYEIEALAFSSDESVIVAAGVPGFVAAWRRDDCTTLFAFDAVPEGAIVNIAGVGFFDGGRSLWTAHGDGAIRTWDVATGAALAATEGGAIIESAVALPGDQLVLARWDGTVSWFDLGRFEVVRTFQAHDARIGGLDATADGRIVVTAGGVHPYNMAPAYNLEQRNGDVSIRIWDPDGALDRPVAKFGDKPIITSMAAAPGSTELLVGDSLGVVHRWDLARLYHEVVVRHDGWVASVTTDQAGVAWSAGEDGRIYRLTSPVPELVDDLDGALLAFAVRDGVEGEPRVLVTYAADAPRDLFSESHLVIRRGADRVDRLDDAPSVGAIAIDRAGHVLTGRLGGPTLDELELEGHEWPTPINAVALSPDGRLAATGGWDSTVRLWSTTDGEALGIAFRLSPITALAFSPDGDTLLVGNDGGSAFLVDVATLEATQLDLAHDGAVLAVAFVGPHAEYIATGGDDGVVKISRRTGEEVLDLVAHDASWVMWTPDGYFEASRDGGGMLAIEHGATSYSIEQVAARQNRPDLIAGRLGLSPDDLVEHFAAQVRHRGAGGEPGTPPEARIVSRSQDGRVGRVEVDFQATAAELRSYAVAINGVVVASGAIDGRTVTRRFELDLASGPNLVEVSAFDAGGAESLRTRTVFRVDEVTPRDLYVVAFGVSDHRLDAYDLAYAHQDARDLAATLAEAPGFAHVHTFVRTDAEVTRTAFADAAAFLGDAGVDDLVIVFLAGHGVHDGDADATYYFLPHDGDPDRLAETAISFATVETVFDDVHALERLLLVDTCESGDLPDELVAAPEPRVGKARGLVARTPRAIRRRTTRPRPFLADRDRFVYNDLTRRTGAVVYSASTGGELSYESDAIHNGVFTHVLLAALTRDEVDRDRDGRLEIAELIESVTADVAAQTDGLQHPVVDRDNPHVRIAMPMVAHVVIAPVRRGPRGCGCGATDSGSLGLVLLVLAAATRRRRRAVVFRSGYELRARDARVQSRQPTPSTTASML